MREPTKQVQDAPDRVDFLALALISAGTIALEIMLLRVFSFSQWHHFASLAVSLALLGFGTAGTTLVLLGNRRVCRWGDSLFAAGVLVAGAGIILMYPLHQVLELRPLFIAWDLGELLKLLLLNFAAFLPFFGAALSIGQVFVRWPSATRRLYGVNLIGSGIGSLAATVLLSLLSLEWSLFAIALLLLLTGAGFAAARALRKGRGATRTLGLTGLVCGAFTAGLLAYLLLFNPDPALHVSDFKRLSYLLELPDAKIIRRSDGLRDRTTVIRSQHIRVATGLSLNWLEGLPPQDAMVLGADRLIVLPRSVAPNDLQFLKATLQAAPFALRPEPSVAIIGTSANLGTFMPRLYDARRTIWVESHPMIVEEYSRRGLDKRFDEIVMDNPRRFLHATPEQFDLIIHDHLHAGGDALGEEFLLTVESLEAALQRLQPGGLIVLPMQLSNPPRFFPKALRTARQALQSAGLADPQEHVLAMRSMADAIICLGRDPISLHDQKLFRAFAERWRFDLVWLPGLARNEANQIHQFESPLYFEAAASALKNEQPMPSAATLYTLTPATDAAPYFWYSMRWRILPRLWKSVGRQGLVLLDWSALVLGLSLAVAAVLGLLFILLPLGRLPRSCPPLTRPGIFTYFFALGLGYLLLEMAVFQRCVLLLGHPIYAAGVVFAVFLIGSGCGSLHAPEEARKHVAPALFLPIIAGVLLGYIVLWPGVALLWECSVPVRGACVVIALLPLAWAMGRPMPWGLRQLDPIPAMIPWGWGINGFASVLAAPLATMGAILSGQPSVWLAGLCCYMVAWWVARRWLNN